MIQVLLLILRIIGITILAILGLLLLILALLLFVPVFYRVRVIHNPEETRVNVRVTYLFPLLLVTAQYLKRVSYKVRIFGFALLDSDKPKKEKAKKNHRIKNKKQKEKGTKAAIPEPAAESKPKTEEKPPVQPETSGQQRAEQPKQPEQPAEEKKKQSFFDKIRCKIQKIRETISNIIKKIKKLLHQKEEVQRILSKPETGRAVAFAWAKFKQLLKSVFPKKWKGYVAFGAENPATTGQVLGILAIVYAKTGPLLELRPNFEEKQLECDLECRGHIQLVTLLIIAVKLFLNQELKNLITDIKKIKEIE